MTEASGPRHKNLFLVLAALLGVWGVFGAADVAKQPFDGYQSNDGVVTEVDVGGPAASAGMQVGDSLLSLAGVPWGDSQGRSRLARPEIGEIRAIGVDRGGQETTLDLRYAEQPVRSALGNYLVIAMGAIFVAMGLWAYFTVPNAGTLLLALLGFGFGMGFLTGPNIGPGVLGNLANAVGVVGIALGLAALLDFVIRSRRPDGYEPGGGGPRWLYAPAAVIALLLVPLTTFQPNLSGPLNTAIGVVLGGCFLFYFGGALVNVIRNYAKADGAVRASRGLGWMLAGAVVGLTPITLVLVVGLLPGDVNLPGGQFLILGLAAVPIAFALAAVRGSRGVAELA